MKRKLNQLIQNSVLIGSIAVTMASVALAQSNDGDMPPPPPGHGHGPGGPEFFVLLCAGQKLQGVPLPVPPAKPSADVKSKIDAAIQACKAQLPAPPSGSGGSD